MKTTHLRSALIAAFLIFTAGVFGTPSITNVDPVSGTTAGGNTITITGSGFTGATAVKFGTKNAPFFVLNDTTIQVAAPARSPGVVDVTVTTPSGTSAITHPADYYTYQGDWFAYIPSGFPGLVTPIDDRTRVLFPPFTVTSDPVCATISPDGTLGLCADILAPDVVNLVPFDVQSNIPFAPFPSGGSGPDSAVIFSPDNKTAFVINQFSSTASKIDLTTKTSTILSTGTNPFSIALSPDGTTGYVTNFSSSNLTIFDTTTLATSTFPLPAGTGPVSIAITPNGTKALVLDFNNNQVIPINNLNTSRTLGTPIPGFSLQPSSSIMQLAISPDGTTAYVPNSGSNTLSIINGVNTPTPTLGISITVGINPDGVAVTPDGKTVYVCNAGNGVGNTVSIIDLPSLTVTTVTVAGTSPNHPGITPDQAPVAYFSETVNISGKTTTFDASKSLSPTGSIATYTWNFGDGSPIVTTSSPVISHIFPTPGLFNVTLTVTNTAGTSTTLVWTGTTANRNGGPSATLSQAINIPTPPSPPTNLNVCQVANEFLTQTDYVNIITFNPPVDGGTPVFYKIFRNSLTHLIATIPANGPLEFKDHNRKKHTPYTYFVVTVDALGNESAPAVFNFTGQKCHKHK